MENFNDPKGIVIVADTVAILGMALYFYRQNESMRKEIDEIKKNIALVTTKSSRIEKDITTTKEASKKVNKKVSGLENASDELRGDIMAISKKVTVELPSSSTKKRAPKKSKKYNSDSENSDDDDLDNLINNTRT